MRTAVVGSLILAVAALSAGCVQRMMPTPLIYQNPGPDPFTLVPVEERSDHIDVLFASDRAPTRYDTPEAAFSNDRGASLRLGRAVVRFGTGDPDWDALIERIRQDRRPKSTIIDLEEYGKLWTTIPETDAQFRSARGSASPDDDVRTPARRFADELNSRLAKTRHKDVVIYIPGFNTAFDLPVHRMASLGHYLSGDAVCIAYSWPSWQVPFGYSKQLATARTSTRNVREFLKFLASETDVRRIHVIGYSNGAQVLTDALLQLRLELGDAPPEELQRRTRLGYLIYAAADEDLHYFRNACLDGIEDMAVGTVVYASRADIGLHLSWFFASGTRRVGQATHVHRAPDAGRPNAAVVVDATRAIYRWHGDGLYDHSYWYTNPWVSSDIILMLRHDLPPQRRALVPASNAPPGTAWAFPGDYRQRAANIARDALFDLAQARP